MPAPTADDDSDAESESSSDEEDENDGGMSNPPVLQARLWFLIIYDSFVF